MSKPSGSRRRKKAPPKKSPKRSTSDRAIYLCLLIIGGAVLGLALLLGEGKQYVGPVALAYVAALAWLANLYGWGAYRGETLGGWKGALARVPLRFAGYGAQGGRPLEAAHGAPSARTTLFVSAVVSLVLVGGLAAWMFV
jgi:hypothetical protein